MATTTVCDYCKKIIPLSLPREQTEVIEISLPTGNRQPDGRYKRDRLILCDTTCLQGLLTARAK